MTVRIESNSYLTDDQHRVYGLREALERNGGTPSGFLELLASVVADQTWRKVPSGVNSEEPFEDFSSFIEAKPPFGLGAKIDDVRVLLQLKHPHEGVGRIREQMDAMRAEVAALLGPASDEDPVTRDAVEFGAYARAGGWMFAVKVARCVHPGGSQSDTTSSLPHNSSDGVRKVSANEFARRAKTSASRVMRFYRAWEHAAAEGIVPGFEDLHPGVDVELPDAELWTLYYAPRTSADSERGALISAAAEAEGIRPTKALEVSENPTALRAAILADSRTAEAARTALMDRLESDTDLQVTMAKYIADTSTLKKAVAAETKRADQIEYVRTAVEAGTIKTPTGQAVEIPEEIKEEAKRHLNLVDQDIPGSPEDATAAYEVLHRFVSQSVDADPVVKVRERRAKFYGQISQASKTFEQLSLDDVGELYEEELVEKLERLQGSISACIENLKKSAQPAVLRAVSSA
jgi:hypothetical protein